VAVSAQSNFDLSPADWETLRRLLHEALDQDPAQRATWIEALRAELADFKRRLHALLAHAGDDAGPSFLQTLPKIETGAFAARPGSDADHERSAGQCIGPYRLLRLLSSGGMGSVWLAERTDILQGRAIALKLPNSFGRATAFVERMAREREISAAHGSTIPQCDADAHPLSSPSHCRALPTAPYVFL
jgi:eukaryotic-like serine/threonine-protein kinase